MYFTNNEQLEGRNVVGETTLWGQTRRNMVKDGYGWRTLAEGFFVAWKDTALNGTE